MKLLSIFFLLIPQMVYCQIYTGLIKDSITNQNIEFANIYWQKSKIGTISDDAGKFTIKASPVDNDTVIFSHISYTPKRIILNSDVNNVEIFLSPANNIVNEIIIKPIDISLIIDRIIKNLNHNYPSETTLLPASVSHYSSINGDTAFSFQGNMLMLLKSYIIQNNDFYSFLSDSINLAINQSYQPDIRRNLNGFDYQKISPPYYYPFYLSGAMQKIYLKKLPFLKQKNIYAYNIEHVIYKGIDSYKISYAPIKERKNNFHYQGYFFVNSDDYAIYDLYAELYTSYKNCEKVISNSEKSQGKYIFEKETYKLEFQNKQGKYILNSFNIFSSFKFKNKTVTHEYLSQTNLYNSNNAYSYGNDIISTENFMPITHLKETRKMIFLKKQAQKIIDKLEQNQDYEE